METNKLKFTTNFLAEKEIESILSKLYWEEKFNGCVDIWLEDSIENNKEVKVEIKYKKLLKTNAPETNQYCLRFEIIPNKGIKRLL